MIDPALMTAEALLAGYARLELTPVDALQAIVSRIARLNPRFNAFAVMNPNALAAAGESAARWRAGRPMGALDGVPCTIKDLIDVAGSPTRRGSRLTDAAPVAEDAPLVLSLRMAGAVIVGKTTTTEFGWKSPGDCPLHGITRNPWERRSQPRRLVVRGGRCCRCVFRSAARRHRCRRLGAHTGGVVRAGRAEAHIRPRAALAARRVLLGRLRGSDHPHRRRRRADAVGAGAA